LAEQRVVPGQPPGQVGGADEELAAVRVGPGVGHCQRTTAVVAMDRLVGELVARPARPDPGRIQRGLLAVLPVAALDHEAGDDAMEDHVVVEALLRQVDEVLGGLRGGLGEQVELDVAELRGNGRLGHALLLTGSRRVPPRWRRARWRWSVRRWALPSGPGWVVT